MADVQTTQVFEDFHATLTPVNPDGQQQSSYMSSQFMTSMLNPTPDAGIESIFKTSSHMDVQPQTTVAHLPLSEPTLTLSTIVTVTTIQQAPTPQKTTPSTLLQDLPNFGSLFVFDHRLKTLEVNFSEFMQTNQFAGAVSSILGIAQRYMDQRMNEAVKIINEQVKEQVKVQVSKILPRIEQTVNEQLEAEVLTRSSNSSKTSYAVAADLSEMELKKILIEKMEGNKTSAGSDRGSKRRREGKEPESASTPKEKATKSAGKSTQGSKSRQTSASESAIAEEPMQTTHEMEEPSHPEFETRADDQPIAEPSQHPEWFSQQKKPPTPDQEVYKATTDQLDWINPEGQQYPHNPLKPLPLIPNSRGRRVIPFDHFINNDLGYLRGGASSRKYATSVTKTKATDNGHIKWIKDLVPRTIWIQELVGYDKHALRGISHWGLKRQQFYGFAVNRESARDVYSKRRIIAVIELKIVEWHNYNHLDWITVHRDDDKLYKFKEGDFKRLRIQDIEDMLLLLVQGKLTNLTVEERFAFNVSLRMFTRSIVIQRRVEDLQLGVESYQKKLNLTRPDMYRSDLKRNKAYTTYSNPRGFIYQNKDMQNRLMQIDELHKFNDGTLTDVHTTLDDRLKGIRMKYLPQTIWRKSDKEIEAATIQAIDK
nr:hypothetical protein [Tanacetum cinerariifolium]